MTETVPTLVPVKGAGMAIRHKKPESAKSSERVKNVAPAPPPLIDFDAEIEQQETQAVTHTYTISPANIEKFTNAIAKANRRLERGGVAERFEYTLDAQYKSDGNGGYYEHVTATLTKPVIKHNGWSFAGAHEFTPNGGVVSFWAEDANLEAPTEPVCDQCGIKRHRERVYTVKNGSETKRVGSSCMNLFLGVTPEGLWTLNGKLEDELEGFSNSSMSAERAAYDTKTLIALALAESNSGSEFVPNSRGTVLTPSTATRVRVAIETDIKGRGLERYEYEAEKVIEFVRGLAGDNDYESNLKQIFLPSEDGLPDMVKSKHLAFAVSAVSAYYRSLNPREKVEEKIGRTVKNEYFGTKGERFDTPVKLTVEKRMVFENDFGTSTVFIMYDDEGRTFKWSSSNPPDVWEGGTVDIKKATVKDHKEYEGQFQTVITRPSVSESTDLGRAPQWKLYEIVRERFSTLDDGNGGTIPNPDYDAEMERFEALQTPSEIKDYFSNLGYTLTAVD